MYAVEQKAFIRGFIKESENLISVLLEKQKVFEHIVEEAGHLDSLVYDLIDDSPEVFDIEEFSAKLCDNLLHLELQYMYDDIYSFQEEIDSLISDSTEMKADKLNEKYHQLDEILEKFNQDIQQYGNINEAIENIEEAIYMLKEIK